MKYTIIIDKDGEQLAFEHVRKFWADTKTLLLDMGDHHVHFKDYDGLIIHKEI